VVDDVVLSNPRLLDRDERRRLRAWLRRAPWDRLLDLGDDASEGILHELDRNVFRSENPWPGIDLRTRKALNRSRAYRLMGEIWEALWRQSDRDQLFALGCEVAARRGRRHLDAFLSVLADDHVELHEQLRAITASVDDVAEAVRRLPFELEAALSPDAVHGAPSLLLRPQLSTVPFLFRQEVLHGLTAWCEQPGALDVLVVAGPAGAGKTRLGLELCRALRGRSWAAGFLDRSASPRDVHAFARGGDCLVVVDYAEARREHVGVLLGTRLGKPSSGRLRVLLLVRDTSRATLDVIDRLGRYHAGADAVLAAARVLVLQPPGPDERRTLFARGALAFAEALGCVERKPVVPPLEADTFANMLFVLLLALDAVLDERAGQPSSRTPRRDELLAEALHHERRYWQQQAVDAGINVDTEIIGRAVAVATLLGAENEGQAAELLRLVPDLADSPAEARHRLARLLHRLHPGPEFLNGLEPDLLGEALVREVLEQVPSLLDEVLDTWRWRRLARAMQVLARAAADRPDTVKRLQQQLDEDAPVLVLRAYGDVDEDDRALFADALAELLEVAPVPPTLGAMSHSVSRDDIALVRLDVVVARQSAENTRELVAVDRLQYLPELGERLSTSPTAWPSSAGRRRPLAASTEAVEVFRGLAAEDRWTYLQPLVTALTVLTQRLADVGDIEALEATGTAVATARQLVELDRTEFLPELASALEFRSTCLARLRRVEEALEAGAEAIAAHREIADRSSRGRHGLAAALHRLSLWLLGFGRREEALAAAEEAVALFRDLHRSDDHSSAEDLATASTGLAACLWHLDRGDEARTVAEEAVAMARALVAGGRRWTALPLLAVCLDNLSNCCATTGRAQEALAAGIEAVDLYRELADRNRAAYLADLTRGLSNLSSSFAAVGRFDEGLGAVVEAWERLRELTDTTPFAYAAPTRVVLGNLARRLDDVGKHDLAAAVRRARDAADDEKTGQ
jgi:tetratricopeptide (TPR) repeat protein